MVLAWDIDRLRADLKKQSDKTKDADYGPNIDPEAGAPEAKIDTFKFEDMHSFVTNPACWTYLHIILMLSQVLRVAEAWFDSCPCHPNHALSGASYFRRQSDFRKEVFLGEEGKQDMPCPMKGRRAPELARGVFHGLLEQWFPCLF